MNKRLFSTLFLTTIFTWHGFGQEITFEAKAPETVSVGEQFRLIFTINDDGKDFKAPQKIEGFNTLYGPSTSSSYSSSVVGGKTITQVSNSYSYLLQAVKEGTFSIPKASIVVEGKTFYSNSLKIKVASGNKGKESIENEYQTNKISPKSTSDKISDEDAFIETIISKTQVSEQEAFGVTYKLYTKLAVQEVRRTRLPDFDGFQVDNLNVDNLQYQTESYNGQDYHTAILRKILLTPLQKGTLEIPESTIALVFQIPAGVRTIFGEQTVWATKYFTTKPAKVKVSRIPTPKPVGFSNVAGNFSISSSISTTRAKVNNPVLIRIVISGNGNTIRVPVPELELPSEFDFNRPQISQNVDVTNDDVLGTKTIEYLFIPRQTGEYKIPSVSIPYFDTASKSYKTLSTPEYNLRVDKDSNKNSKEVFVQIDSPQSGELIL
ncbi:MAG: hypothetical protein H6Q14_1692 [Bacteroidetes bacterium]|nr:hypothetical protein [Bacteroidota bacterium]